MTADAVYQLFDRALKLLKVLNIGLGGKPLTGKLYDASLTVNSDGIWVLNVDMGLINVHCESDTPDMLSDLLSNAVLPRLTMYTDQLRRVRAHFTAQTTEAALVALPFVFTPHLLRGSSPTGDQCTLSLELNGTIAVATTGNTIAAKMRLLTQACERLAV